MSIELELPAELETKLAKEATEQGVPLSEYLVRILANSNPSVADIENGADIVAYWRKAGLIGTRADIRDSQQHARSLRAEAERRGRS